jgi:hypothetical protein
VSATEDLIAVAPDLLGDGRRAELVLDMLRTIQEALFRLEVEAVANDSSDNDPAPGRHGAEGKTVATYREELFAAERRVVERYGEQLPGLVKITQEPS